MKKCPNCQSDVQDNARFCPTCGTMLPVNDVQPEEEETIFIEETGQSDSSASAQSAWDAMQSAGNSQNSMPTGAQASSKQEHSFRQKLQQEPSQNQELVQSMQQYSQSSSQQNAQSDYSSQNSQSQSSFEEEQNWYYVENGATTGPFGLTTIISLIQAGTLTKDSYVWTSGMENWEMIQDTPLAEYLPSRAFKSTFASYEEKPQPETNEAVNPAYTDYTYESPQPAAGGMIESRSMILWILLSICTCSIGYYVWLYNMAKDTNKVLKACHEKELTSAGKVVLFSIITCGVYSVYFFWRGASSLRQCEINGRKPKDVSVVAPILAVLSSILGAVIYQTVLNDIAQGN